MTAAAALNTKNHAVKCECGHTIFDGEVIKSRCVRVGATKSYALCRCKSWVKIPVRYSI